MRKSFDKDLLEDADLNYIVINGPNINMIGIREPEIYGHDTYSDLCDFIKKFALEMGDTVTVVQSNCEGKVVDYIQDSYGKYDGIVINAGAYTHYSYAILDALKAVSEKVSAVEVHLSDINKRDEFRKNSVIRPACVDVVCGMGIKGYKEAAVRLKKYLSDNGKI